MKDKKIKNTQGITAQIAAIDARVAGKQKSEESAYAILQYLLERNAAFDRILLCYEPVNGVRRAKVAISPLGITARIEMFFKTLPAAIDFVSRLNTVPDLLSYNTTAIFQWMEAA